MRTKSFLFLFFILFTALVWPGHAQEHKRSLSHDDYDGWESVSQTTLSPDGKWVGIEVSLQDGDGRAQLIPTSKGMSGIKVPRLKRLNFSEDSHWAIGLITAESDSIRLMKLKGIDKSEFPMDSLFVMDLESKSIVKIPGVENFQLPDERKSWYAYEVRNDTTGSQKEEKNDNRDEEKTFTLHIERFGKKRAIVRENVSKYGFAPNGERLFFVQNFPGNDQAASQLRLLDLESEKEITVLDSLVQYRHMVFSEDAGRFAFLGSRQSAKDSVEFFDLFYQEGGQQLLRKELANKTISEHYPLRFSKDGQKLFFGWKEPLRSYVYASDTSILDEERVSVDIWGWQDAEIQPMQLKNLEDKKEESFVAVYHIAEDRVLSIGDPNTGEVHFNPDYTTDWAIALNDRPYRKNYSWNIQIGKDLSRVSVKTGQVDLLAREVVGSPRISPGGRYAFWYSNPDSTWMAYVLKTKEEIALTTGLEDIFYDDLHDSPSFPGSNGHAGWSADDRYFLVNGKYDIWKIDPKGEEAPVNLSNGHGDVNQVRYRLIDLDPDVHFVDLDQKLVFSGMDMNTMESGFFIADACGRQDPEVLVFGAAAFDGLKRAENGSNYLYQKSTFSHPPDVYLATGPFKNSRQLTHINPQQEDILWGSAELVSYRVHDGDMMDGLLFKPENFDPEKKYPMMVYFYERSSTTLNRYRAPVPSASIINIPFFVSNGYLVFVPDIQYKIGLPGPSAYDCVVPGVQAMIAKGFVDPANIGIQGQSWGGYQVAYIITRTNMFKAAGAGAPVANMTSAYGGIRWGSGMSRMFQYEQTQSRIGGTLWEKPMHYLENSPLFYADRIQTPTLIMHNDADGAVPWYQGIEFFMALKRNSVPSWLLVYNGEDHNLRERKNKKDLSIRLSQFFDHYLKGAPEPLWMKEGIPAIEKGKTLKYELSEE